MGWYPLRIRPQGARVEGGATFNIEDGAELQIEGVALTSGAYFLNSVAYSPEHFASGVIDVNTGAAEADTEVEIGDFVYLEDSVAGPDPTEGIWVNGGSQEDSVDSLLAAINGDTRPGNPAVTAVKVGTHSIVLFADVPGEAGNLDVSTDSVARVTVEDLEGGVEAGLIRMIAIEREVTDQDVLADWVHIKLPFAPAYWRHYVVDSSGSAKTPTGACTLEAGPPLHILHKVDSGTDLVAGDVIHVIAVG